MKVLAALRGEGHFRWGFRAIADLSRGGVLSEGRAGGLTRPEIRQRARVVFRYKQQLKVPRMVFLKQFTKIQQLSWT